LEARILHVADVFDTMSVFCSNFAVHPATANVELLRHAGTKFDSDVVAACLRCTEVFRTPAAFRTAGRPA
jgi:HD-GYP domain-containing protein (c-di-GMP phosphodiesterase class II)